MYNEFDTTVLGGLPVTIRFDEYDTSDWHVYAVGGKVCKSVPNWIYKRISADDEREISEECLSYSWGK